MKPVVLLGLALVVASCSARGAGGINPPAGSDGGAMSTTDTGTTTPPADTGTVTPPADAGTVVTPPADSGTVTPPADSGTVTPPMDAGTVTPPADSGAVTPPVDSGPPVDPCAARASCGGCTPVNGCGWCFGTNRCVSGDPSGSLDRTCTGPRWAWTPTQCTPDAGTTPPIDRPDPCASVSDCTTCRNTAGCGWCGNVARCFSGTTFGPDNNACDLVAWRWGEGTCGTVNPSDPCSRYTTCGGCAAIEGCGWCGNVGTCHSGTVRGPTASACGAVSWVWDPRQCL